MDFWNILYYSDLIFFIFVCLTVVYMGVFAMASMFSQHQETPKSRKENRDILFIETCPCTEFWFLLHFLPDNTVRRFQNYDQLIPELRKYMPGYEKTKHYFIRTKLYDYLVANGSLERAKSNAERLSELSKASPEDRIAYSEIHKVINLLDELKKQ